MKSLLSLGLFLMALTALVAGLVFKLWGDSPEPDEADAPAAAALTGESTVPPEKRFIAKPAFTEETQGNDAEREDGPQGAPRFPVERTITDTRGRALEVRVTKRDAEAIYAVRLSDGETFRIPLDKLSAADRSYFTAFPVTASAPPGRGETGEPREPAFVANYRAMIKELQKEMDQLRRERNASTDDALRRTLRNEMREIEERIEEMKQEIAEALGE